MTTYYKRITGSKIQGDATAIAEQPGTLVINDDGTLHIHDGTTVGGNPIGGGAANALTSGSYTVSLSSSTGALTLSTASTILGSGTVPNVYIQTNTTATTSTWTFGINGQLTLPADTPIINGAGTGTDVTIIAQNTTTTSTWVFGANGALSFPDSSVQTTSAQVQFRAPNLPIGAAGDTQGALAYNTITNSFYLATASYVQQVQTTSTFDIVSSEPYDWGQSGDQFMSVTILKGTYPGIDTLLNAGVTTGWTISGGDPTIYGTVTVTNVSLYNTDGISWSFDWAPQEGYPTSFSSGTSFTLYNTSTLPQPVIWQSLNPTPYQLTSGTAHLTVTNGNVGISPGTSIVFDQNTLGDQQGAYLGSGYYEVSEFTTTFFVSPGLPMLLGGAGVQIVDYTSLTDAGNSGAYNTAAAIFVGNTDATGGVEGLQDYNRTIGSVRVQSYNTATTSTYLWTFDNTGVLSIPGTISAGSTATVTSGVARTAWSNFLASQFNDSQSPFIVQDVQHDQAGNVIATLTDANTGTDVITINTQTSMVVKYSPEGAVLWSQQITGPIAPATFGLAVDSGNNIYINLVDLATTTTTVVKLLGTDGSLVWATDLTDAGDVGFNALISPDGNLVVNGVYNNAGSNNMYLMKINSTTGSVMWQKQLPDTGSNDIDTGLAIDPNSGNIAVSGSVSGGNLGFVGIVDSNGNYVNGAEFTVNIGAGLCEVSDAIYDSQGHLYVSGAVSTASTVTAGFLAKIDTNLSLLWARQIGQGDGCIDVATSLVVDEHDNVYVSGFTSDPNHGGLPVTSLGSFAPDGTERWQYWFETSANSVTSPGGLGSTVFQNSFTDLGNNTSYHNGMIALGVISGYNSYYYPYVLQVPADGTPVSFGDYGMNMLPIYSTTSTWAAITATVTVTTGFPLTISAGTLTVATDVSVASAGISLGYNGTFEYDYTTSTVYTPQSSWQFNPDGTTDFPHFTISTATGTTGTVLTLNGSGIASWQTPTGGSGWQLTSSTAVLNLDSAGTVTLPMGGTIVEATSPSGVGKTISLTPFGGTDTNQQLLIYPTVVEGNHLHLTSGSLPDTSLFLGNDNQYVRTRADGAMVIGTGDSVPDQAGVGHRWVFDTSGVLTFPDMTAQSTAWLGAGSYDISNFNNGGTFTLPYSQLSGAPTNVSAFTNDAGYLTSAFSGNYSDLSGAPNLANVATSGNYSDLSGAPTDVGQFSNNVGYITTWSLVQDSNPTLSGTLNLNGNKLQSAVTGQYAASTNHPVTLEAQYSYNATSWEMTGTGEGYSNGTNIATTGGSGTGMTVNIYTNAGQVNDIQVVNPGTGYQNGDLIYITGGDGTAVFVIHNYNSLNNGATADWTFGIDNSLHGIMTLPQGSTIGETPSTTVLTPPGTSSGWTFDTTGILTVPITASGAGQISGGTNGLQLVSNSNTWGFGTDASTTIPGIINLPNGQGQIGNNGAGIDIICNVNSYGYITLNYLSQASVSVNTSGIVLTSNSSSWTFNSGGIQFPDSTNQLTAFELQGVPPLSPWGTTYPSSGGIANLDYQFYFDPTSGYPTIQSYASAGGNPLYNSIWSYDAWLAASSSPNPIAGSSGSTPVQVTNTGGVTVIGSQLQPGDYVTVRIMNIDTGRIFRATFMGSVDPNDFNITNYGSITVERLL